MLLFFFFFDYCFSKKLNRKKSLKISMKIIVENLSEVPGALVGTTY